MTREMLVEEQHYLSKLILCIEMIESIYELLVKWFPTVGFDS